MRERNVSASEVLRVTQEHEVAFTDKKGNPCFVQTIDGRRIKVVVSAADASFVITVIDLDA